VSEQPPRLNPRKFAWILLVQKKLTPRNHIVARTKMKPFALLVALLMVLFGHLVDEACCFEGDSHYLIHGIHRLLHGLDGSTMAMSLGTRTRKLKMGSSTSGKGMMGGGADMSAKMGSGMGTYGSAKMMGDGSVKMMSSKGTYGSAKSPKSPKLKSPKSPKGGKGMKGGTYGSVKSPKGSTTGKGMKGGRRI
jgi:hypothetical protein